jgi:hypothetical protein
MEFGHDVRGGIVAGPEVRSEAGDEDERGITTHGARVLAAARAE